MPRHRASASLLHSASVRPNASFALSCAHFRASASIPLSQLARNAFQSLRLASAASQSLRNASATTWPRYLARKAAPRSGGKLAKPLRNAAYSSHPASGWFAYAASAFASSVPRVAASNAPRKPASGIAMRVGGLAARGGGSGACAQALPARQPLASRAASSKGLNLCIAGL